MYATKQLNEAISISWLISKKRKDLQQLSFTKLLFRRAFWNKNGIGNKTVSQPLHWPPYSKNGRVCSYHRLIFSGKSGRNPSI
jgi:hypothetical protein